MSSASPAVALFKRHFGFTPPLTVRAPGRLELLGNHTDYNEGLVLAAAVDRAVWLAAAPRKDGRVELVSSAFPGVEKFAARAPERNPAAPWADYVKGVLDQLRQRGAAVSGFTAAIDSTIPPGAGLGSSGALLVATALAVRAFYPYTLTPTGLAAPPARRQDGSVPPPARPERLEIARLCRAAEEDFIGVRCGLLDQLACLFGKSFHALEIDCQSLAIERVPMAGEIALVVCDSGVKHRHAAGGYNELRAACAAAARALGVKSLRSVDPPLVEARRGALNEREHACARHVTGENRRVLFATRALREGDFEQFGQYLLQSHESSRDLLGNSCPELDLLVALARTHPACLGARLTGGGFGGATLNLVRRESVDAFCRDLAAAWQTRTGRALEPMRCATADGAEATFRA
jgi:galactokinase